MQLLKDVFKGISQEERQKLEAELDLGYREMIPGEFLSCRELRHGYVYILYSGKAHAVRYASDGREVDYHLFESGELLTEASDLFGNHQNEYVIFADSNCTVLYFFYEALERSVRPTAIKLTAWLLKASAKRVIALHQRIRCLTCASLREKILEYLTECSVADEWFEIPLDRNGMASYLFCDRTALCRELSHMKKEGLIDYRKNKFRILLGQNSKK